jgi:predicted RNA-binding Zn-ribbon protein involved in translation (DUF1610 family)
MWSSSTVGTKRFHEGTRAWDFLGGIWELLKNREHYDVYVCKRCGRLEFFVDGLGEELRGEPRESDVDLPPPDAPPPEDVYSAEPIECLQCGNTIAAGVSQCPKCGWSYTAPEGPV